MGEHWVTGREWERYLTFFRIKNWDGADLKNEAGSSQTIRNQKVFLLVLRNYTVSSPRVQRAMKKADGCLKTANTQQERLTVFPGERRAPPVLTLLWRSPGPQFLETIPLIGCKTELSRCSRAFDNYIDIFDFIKMRSYCKITFVIFQDDRLWGKKCTCIFTW